MHIPPSSNIPCHNDDNVTNLWLGLSGYHGVSAFWGTPGYGSACELSVQAVSFFTAAELLFRWLYLTLQYIELQRGQISIGTGEVIQGSDLKRLGRLMVSFWKQSHRPLLLW